MLVRELMTPEPTTVHPSLDLPQAAHLMKSSQIRHLPVVVHHKLCGIISDRDLKAAAPSCASSLSFWDLAYLLSRLTVNDVMTRSVITVAADTPIEEAALLMYRNKIGALPVVNDDNELLGILSENDLLYHVAYMQGGLPGSLTVKLHNTPAHRSRLSALLHLQQVRSIQFSEDGSLISVVYRLERHDPAQIAELLEEIASNQVDVVEWIAPVGNETLGRTVARARA